MEIIINFVTVILHGVLKDLEVYFKTFLKHTESIKEVSSFLK